MWKDFKKSNKDYNFWLENEMDDYYLDAPDNEDIIDSLNKKYNQRKSSHPSSSSSKSLDNKSQKKKNYSRYRNHVKCSETFNFAETFNNLSESTVIKISLFLSLKDFAIFITTCKIVKERADSHKSWIERSKRDFLNLRLDETCFRNTNVSQLYRFLHFLETKSEIQYDTQAFPETRHKSLRLWKPNPTIPLDSSFELSKTLIDSISTKTPLVNHYIYQMIPEYYRYSTKYSKGTSWQPNLNLSWLEKKSGIQLWLGGMIDGKPKTKKLRSIRLLGDEVGQKAYVLEGKYVIIESKIPTLENQEETKDENFPVTIVDLEEALKDHCVSTAQYFWRYCFHKTLLLETESESERMNQVEKQTFDQGSMIDVAIQNKDLPNTKIQQTISKEGLQVFYTQNTNYPSLFIFDPKEKKSYLKINLNLVSPLYQVFLAKKVNQKEEFTAYIIDQALNLYFVKYSQEKDLLSIQKLSLNSQTNEENEPESTKQGIFKIKKEFHYGISKTDDIEYLVLFKDRTFYLVNLATLQFSSRSLIYHNYEVVYDWVVYNKSLYLFENQQTISFGLNFLNPNIEKPRSEWQVRTVPWIYERFSRRWICINPCYTIHVEVTPYYVGPRSVMSASVISTQKSFASKNPTLETCFNHIFTLKFENFIDHPDYEDRINEIAEHMNIKVEDNTLVVQTSTRSFFVNLEAYRKSAPTRFVGNSLTFTTGRNFKLVEMTEEEKYAKQKISVPLKEKRKHVVALNSIHENWNHNLPRTRQQKTNWKESEKKDNKEERKEDRVVRQKGDKYYKNVRHDQFQQKIL